MADGGEDDKVPGRVEGIFCKRRVKETMCQPCLSKDEKNVADKFCSTCNEFLCNDCSGVHNVLGIFISHKLLNANVAHVIRCDQHQKVLDFFCEDENKLCCSTCAIVDHRKCHSVVEVEKIAGKMTSPSSSLEEILQEAKENVENIARDIITSKDQLAQDVEEIQAIIKKMRDEVVKMFNELEVSIGKRAKSLQKEKIKIGDLEKKQSQIEKHLAKVTAFLETVHNIYKNGTPKQTFIAERKMESEVNVVCRNVNEECQNFQTMTMSFDFDEQLTLPPQSINDFVPGQLTLKYHQQEIVNAVNKVMPLTPVSSIELKKTGDDAEKTFVTGLDFLADGRLVVTDHFNRKFLVYNENLEKVGSYQLSYNPLSVVAVSEDEVAITSGYIIEFLRVSKANEIRSNRKCKVTKRYDYICLKDNSQFVVGAIDYQIPVEIISLAGEPNAFSINFPNKAYPVNTRAFTYIRSRDKLVLTDRYEHTVYIYDIKTNTRVLVKDDQIKEPCGVAVGPSDTILVCSNGTDTIVELSQTGQILSSHKKDMKNPFRACVSRDKSFLVVTNSSYGNVKMQKFKISL